MKKKLFTLLSLLVLFVCGISAQTPHEVSGTEKFDLLKTTILANDFMSYSVDKWATSKTYCDYTGDFYNMSSGRSLSFSVSNVESFYFVVQNTTAGRSYSITIDNGNAVVVTHGGQKCEESVLVPTNNIGNITIKIEGLDSSIYPVAIVLNAPSGPSSDATIKSLTVNEETVTANENVYSIELPNSYAEATVPVVITPNGDKAVVTVSTDTDVNTTAGVYTTSVTVPASDVTITVTPENPEATPITYTLNVTKATTASSDNSLASVTLDGETLVADADGNYTKDISFAYAGELLVVATATDDAVKSVDITNNNPTIAGGASAIVTIKVTAENNDVKEYTVTINRIAASTACELNSFTINGFVGTIDGQNINVKTVEGYDFSHTPMMSVSSLATAVWNAETKKVTVTAENGATSEYTVVVASEAIQPYKVEAEKEFSFAAAEYDTPVEWMYGTSWSETMKGCTADDKNTAIGGYEIKQSAGDATKSEAYTAAGSIYLHIYVSNCATLKLHAGATGGRNMKASINGVQCGELTLTNGTKADLVCTVNSAEPVVVSIEAPGATGGSRIYGMTATPYQGGNNIDSGVADNGMSIYTADGMIHVSVATAQFANVYSIDGHLVRVAELVAGDNTISGLAKGMYLVNNQKVVIK